MPDWALIEGQRAEAIGVGLAGTTPTTLTNSGTAHVKGGFTELIAATAFDAVALTLFGVPSVALGDALVDIAVGGAGVEQVVVPNILITSDGIPFNRNVMSLPISIPAGSRISARQQSSSITSVIRLTGVLTGASFLPSQPPQLVENDGANTADSGGVLVDAGATANTKGAWSQLVAATACQSAALVVMAGNALNQDRTLCNWLVDIGIGGAGSEQVLIPNIFFETIDNSGSPWPAWWGAFLTQIPAGSRLSARAQCSIITAGDRALDIALLRVS